MYVIYIIHPTLYLDVTVKYNTKEIEIIIKGRVRMECRYDVEKFNIVDSFKYILI